MASHFNIKTILCTVFNLAVHKKKSQMALGIKNSWKYEKDLIGNYIKPKYPKINNYPTRHYNTPQSGNSSHNILHNCCLRCKKTHGLISLDRWCEYFRQSVDNIL